MPEDWKEAGVSFHNLRGEGGVLVSAWMARSRLTQMSLTATRAGTFVVANSFDHDQLATRRASGEQTVTCPVGDWFEIALEAQETCVITIP